MACTYLTDSTIRVKTAILIEINIYETCFGQMSFFFNVFRSILSMLTLHLAGQFGSDVVVNVIIL